MLGRGRWLKRDDFDIVVIAGGCLNLGVPIALELVHMSVNVIPITRSNHCHSLSVLIAILLFEQGMNDISWVTWNIKRLHPT